MIIGNPRVFAIESSIARAYERWSFRALGFFVIYVGGRCYGNRSPESTMLACSFDEVGRRLAGRGSHIAPFAAESDAGKIADAFRDALYAERPQPTHFGMPLAQFSEIIQSNRIMWAPDGDQAFDDGSYVLHFDLQNRVRLIAFKRGQGCEHDPDTLRDVWLTAEGYYHILQEWHNSFEAEWARLPKVSE